MYVGFLCVQTLVDRLPAPSVHTLVGDDLIFYHARVHSQMNERCNDKDNFFVTSGQNRFSCGLFRALDVVDVNLKTRYKACDDP